MMDRKYNDLIGDILESTGEKDQFMHNKKGKQLPKDYLKKDILQNFQEKAKEAGFLPPWLKLQKEITSLVANAKTEFDIELINKRIKEYNKLCPTPMQKSLVYFEQLHKARESWK